MPNSSRVDPRCRSPSLTDRQTDREQFPLSCLSEVDSAAAPCPRTALVRVDYPYQVSQCRRRAELFIQSVSYVPGSLGDLSTRDRDQLCKFYVSLRMDGYMDVKLAEAVDIVCDGGLSTWDGR